MTIRIEFEIAEDIASVHEALSLSENMLETLSANIAKTLELKKNISCSLRLVSVRESQYLNHTFRNQDKPTNVLSFPADVPDFVDTDTVGDLAICADLVVSQAQEQNKTVRNHFLHLIVHGILHLLGFDHIDPEDADEMESLEIAILGQLGIDDPYLLQ